MLIYKPDDSEVLSISLLDFAQCLFQFRLARQPPVIFARGTHSRYDNAYLTPSIQPAAR
jgi:hypothetical protein